ncbi:MAG: glycosyltransferase [bacterium]|jgi:glycosyltransferase involved in cell wall biosynthesis|nr:glycosyltransferase [bacterium]
MMKILMISGVYKGDKSGVADYCGHLVDHLRLQGLEVSVAAPAGKEASPQDRSVELYGWGGASLYRIMAVIQASNPDIVHLQYQTDIYEATLFPMRLAREVRRSGRPLVITFHDTHGPFLFPRAGRLRKLPLCRFIRNASSLIVSNEGDLAELRRLSSILPGAEIIPVGPGIIPTDMTEDEVASLRKEIGASDAALIGHFGFIHKAKGLDILLRSFALASRQMENCRLIIIGGLDWKGELAAYKRELEDYAGRIGINERLLWLPTMPKREASRYLHICDLMVMPYEDGASGRRSSLFTALAHGLPVITTYGDNMFAGFSHGENLWLTDGSSEDIAAGIIKLLSDASARRRISEGARRLSGALSWERIACEHAHIYQALVRSLAS